MVAAATWNLPCSWHTLNWSELDWTIGVFVSQLFSRVMRLIPTRGWRWISFFDFSIQLQLNNLTFKRAAKKTKIHWNFAQTFLLVVVDRVWLTAKLVRLLRLFPSFLRHPQHYVCCSSVVIGIRGCMGATNWLCLIKWWKSHTIST